MHILRRVSHRVANIHLDRDTYLQFFRFAVSGGVCALLEMALLIYLVELYGELYLQLFNSLAFSLAVLLNYFLSRYWVFEPGRHSGMVEVIAFFSTAFVGLGLNYMLMWLAVEQLAIHYILAKVMAIAAVVAWNYATKKYIVFRG